MSAITTRVASGGFPQLGIPANAYQGWAVWLLPFIEQDNIRRIYDSSFTLGTTTTARRS
jgi:hypothetical protein